MRSRGEVRPRLTGTLLALTISCIGALAKADCGDGILESDTEECDVANEAVADSCSEDCRFECTTNVNDTVADHTCTHVTNGPFGTQFAQTYPGTISTEVSQTHVYFAITMARNDEDEVVDSAINWVPNGSADFALYLNESESVVVLDGQGQNVPPRLDKPVSSCAAGLARVQVYALDVSESYLIVFPAPGPAVRSLVLEQVTASARYYNHDADGDGFGPPQPAVYTWCKVADGAFVEDEQDCDDTRADVYPGAPERCDELDNDCDGLPEQPLQCEPVGSSDETTAPATSTFTEIDAQAPPPAEPDAGTAGADTLAPGETDGVTATSEAPAQSSSHGSTTGDEVDGGWGVVDATVGEMSQDAGGEGRQVTGDAEEATSGSSDEGCGCTVAGGPAHGGAWGVLCALVLFSCGLRRRIRG